MLRVLTALLLLLPALAWSTASPNVLEAKVVGVMDGDTVKVLDANNVEYKIRLAGIDAPEHDQPFGQRSKQSLSRAVMGKNGADRVGQAGPLRPSHRQGLGGPVGTALRTGPSCPKTLDVNLAQLTVGLAWHYKEYAKEQSPRGSRTLRVRRAGSASAQGGTLE